MTKEEALQKANDYCSEKGYTSETLTDEFKDKFADFFSKKYAETDANDESLAADLKFNLNTAFSAASRIITLKQKGFDAKKLELEQKIVELNKKIGETKETPPVVEIPKEIQDQLAELKKFKDDEAKKTLSDTILKLAKKDIRQDLHKSFETFAAGIDVVLGKDANEQATAMVQRFQEIFKDSIGDIKPLAPQQTRKRDSEVMSSLPPIKV